MSHWSKGKLSLKCTKEELKEGLAEAMPQWADHIIENDYAYTWQGKKSKHVYDIVVPGLRNPNAAQASGVRYNDIAIKQESNNTWIIVVDEGLPGSISDLEDTLSTKLASKKTKKHYINKLGAKLIDEAEEEDGGVIELTFRGRGGRIRA